MFTEEKSCWFSRLILRYISCVDFFSLSCSASCVSLSRPYSQVESENEGLKKRFRGSRGFYSAGAFFRHSLLAVPRRLTNQWIEEGPKKVASSTRPPLSGSPLFPFLFPVSISATTHYFPAILIKMEKETEKAEGNASLHCIVHSNVEL